MTAGHILVGDIGGTRARLGLVDAAGELTREEVLTCSRYSSVVEALRSYLMGHSEVQPAHAALAIACPVLEDRVRMTNHPWSFSIRETRSELGLETLEVLNDFVALALALPVLRSEDTRLIKEGEEAPGSPLALIGPGTGLGVSALVPTGEAWLALSTEGGHRDLAATTEREWRIIEKLRPRFGRVSAERVLSGPGLVNLYEAICELDEVQPETHESAEVVEGAGEENRPACREAVHVFSKQLGAVAGDLALTLGARGGVFLGGGVLPRMGSSFDVDVFVQAFVDKGRFRSYVEPIPVRLVTRTKAALLGAARAVESAVPTGVRESG